MAATLETDLQVAIELAHGAGKVILQHFGRTARLTKTHAATTNEAVTEADRASQRFIVAGLKNRFPDDGIIGEENDAGDAITCEPARSGDRVWVIDPIDGTNNFVAGFPAFAVCIGLLQAGRPVVGVVYDVCSQRTYAAAAGHGAWLNDQPMHVLTSPLSDCSLLMLTSNNLDPAGRPYSFAQRWIAQNVWKIRVMGSAALEAAQVAAGVAHGAVTVAGKLWDIAAPAAIVLEAGGVITDLMGSAIFPFDVTHYAGQKVPFLAAAPVAMGTLLAELVPSPPSRD